VNAGKRADLGKQAHDFEALYCSPITLEGYGVRLEPLTADHGESLFHAFNHDEELWRYLPVAQPRSLDEMLGWIAKAEWEHQQGKRLPFAVIASGSGQVIGSTSYINMSPSNRNLDVGWTWYSRSSWRTGVNTACKFLLLRYAFETLQCIRVQFRVDVRNVRSQQAIERIGGVREGVLRKAQILHDGHERHVVIYSILDDEWPRCKTWFEQAFAIQQA
jgi:N-acetyltransferase